MAISFASIGSSSNGRYSLVKADQLNPADRAYLDECRRGSRNSSTGVRTFDLGASNPSSASDRGRKLQPHPLAHGGKQSINPYHESFRAAQAQLLQQRIQLKKAGSGGGGGRSGRNGKSCGGGSWSWKRSILLFSVIVLLVGTFIVIACVKAENFREGDYVKFFSLLIPLILLGSLAFVLLSKLTPWLRERRRLRREERVVKSSVENGKTTLPVGETVQVALPTLTKNGDIEVELENNNNCNLNKEVV